MALILLVLLGMVLAGASVWAGKRRLQPRRRPGARPTFTSHAPPPPKAKPPSDFIVMDRLDRIEGITPDIAHGLNRAGILTYADLAALSPERLCAIVQDKVRRAAQRTSDAQSWIAQARALAQQLRRSARRPAS